MPDAKSLQSGFESFEARDIQNLKNGQAICRVEGANNDFSMDVDLAERVDEAIGGANMRRVAERSRKRYAKLREDIERIIEADYDTLDSDDPKPPPSAAKPDVPPTARVPSAFEEETTEADSQSPEPPPIPSTPKQGIGGEEHQRIQDEIRNAAQLYGFIATIERDVLDGSGRVDVAAEREGLRIAFEVARRPAKDEINNLRKCINAGFDIVVGVVPSSRKRSTIRKGLRNEFTNERELRRIELLAPAMVSEFLKRVAESPDPQFPSVSKEKFRFLGYKVMQSYSKMSPEERKRKDEQLLKKIADAMRALEKKKMQQPDQEAD